MLVSWVTCSHKSYVLKVTCRFSCLRRSCWTDSSTTWDAQTLHAAVAVEMPTEILLQRPACLQALLQLLLNADPECESIPFAVLRLLQSLASQLKQMILLSYDAGLQQVVDVGEARSTGPFQARLACWNMALGRQGCKTQIKKFVLHMHRSML